MHQQTLYCGFCGGILGWDMGDKYTKNHSSFYYYLIGWLNN